MIFFWFYLTFQIDSKNENQNVNPARIVRYLYCTNSDLLIIVFFIFFILLFFYSKLCNYLLGSFSFKKKVDICLNVVFQLSFLFICLFLYLKHNNILNKLKETSCILSLILPLIVTHFLSSAQKRIHMMKCCNQALDSQTSRFVFGITISLGFLVCYSRYFATVSHCCDIFDFIKSVFLQKAVFTNIYIIVQFFFLLLEKSAKFKAMLFCHYIFAFVGEFIQIVPDFLNFSKILKFDIFSHSLIFLYYFFCFKKLVKLLIRITHLPQAVIDVDFDQNNNKCQLCHNLLEVNVKKLPCSHCFHISCLADIAITNPKCPICSFDFALIPDVPKYYNNICSNYDENNYNKNNYNENNYNENNSEKFVGEEEEEEEEIKKFDSTNRFHTNGIIKPLKEPQKVDIVSDEDYNNLEEDGKDGVNAFEEEEETKEKNVDFDDLLERIRSLRITAEGVLLDLDKTFDN